MTRKRLIDGDGKPAGFSPLRALPARESVVEGVVESEVERLVNKADLDFLAS